MLLLPLVSNGIVSSCCPGGDKDTIGKGWWGVVGDTPASPTLPTDMMIWSEKGITTTQSNQWQERIELEGKRVESEYLPHDGVFVVNCHPAGDSPPSTQFSSSVVLRVVDAYCLPSTRLVSQGSLSKY